jgi:hypothetical protein
MASGAGLLSRWADEACAQTASDKETASDWQYVPVDPAAAAAEAYRLMPNGGCMYGVFRAVLAAWLNKTGRSADSFPFHMMRYGHGGVGGWGTVCGALNAGAALIGLFEPDKTRQERMIDELFSWYERTELPVYQPSEADSGKIAKSAAASVLCHVSVAHWCKVSGAAPVSDAKKQRCRCLTADVATKTVELLNQYHGSKPIPEPAKLGLKTSSEPPKAIGKMQCTTCHGQ